MRHARWSSWCFAPPSGVQTTRPWLLQRDHLGDTAKQRVPPAASSASPDVHNVNDWRRDSPRLHSLLAARYLEKGPCRMNQSHLLPVALAVLVVAGCASPEPNSAEPQSDKHYVTGSRIPARDGNTSAAVKSVETKEGVDEAAWRQRRCAWEGGCKMMRERQTTRFQLFGFVRANVRTGLKIIS